MPKLCHDGGLLQKFDLVCFQGAASERLDRHLLQTSLVSPVSLLHITKLTRPKMSRPSGVSIKNSEQIVLFFHMLGVDMATITGSQVLNSYSCYGTLTTEGFGVPDIVPGYFLNLQLSQCFQYLCFTCGWGTVLPVRSFRFLGNKNVMVI